MHIELSREQVFDIMVEHDVLGSIKMRVLNLHFERSG